MLFKILDRYLIRELGKTFLLTFLVLTLMFFLMLSLQLVRKYSQFLSFLDILTLAPYMMGKSASFTIPLAMLAATTLIYGRMAYEQEILILRAAGIHFKKMFRPAFLLGFLLSLICLYLNGNIVPLTLMKQREITWKALQTVLSATFSSEETTIRFIPHLRIYYRKLEAGEFRHLVIQHIIQDQVREEVFAQRGRLAYDKEKQLLTFHLQNGNINYIARSTKKSGTKEERVFFDEISLPIALPKEDQQYNYDMAKFKGMTQLYADMGKLRIVFEKVELRLAEARSKPKLPANDLKALEDEYAKAWDDYLTYQMEWHQRIANSLASLLVVLIGAPLGLRIRHDNRLVAFGASALLVLLIYYPLQMWGDTLGDKGVLPPFWASWLGNFVTCGIGISLLVWVYRE